MPIHLPENRKILFLQGPLSPLYSRLGQRLKSQEFGVHRINFCLGDILHWPFGATSFRGQPDKWRNFIANYLDRENITDLVLHGDRRFYHKIAVEEARSRNIYIAVSELGLLRPDWMTFERDGLSVLSRLPDKPEEIRIIAAKIGAIDFTPRFQTSFWKVAIPDIIYNLVNTLCWPAYPNYQRHTIYYPPLEYIAHGLRLATQSHRNRLADTMLQKIIETKRPFFLIPMQLEGDFQLRENSPYNGMGEALAHICRSFREQAPEDTILIAKTHPLDNGLHNWGTVLKTLEEKYELKNRLFFADGGNLTTMAKMSQGVVTVNSTAGLDAMRLGVPVKTLSPSIFDINGLTDQQPLDCFWIKPTRPKTDLLDDFIQAIAGTIQVRGTIYDKAGLDVLIENMARRLTDRNLNMPDAYCAEPPRLARLETLKAKAQFRR